MSSQISNAGSETGMELHDLLTSHEFSGRTAVARTPNRELVALRRLSRLVAEDSTSVLQELVDVAVEFCGADSAGISLEETGEGKFRWIAVSGSFEAYRNGTTPRDYSPCGTCVDAGRPQLYRVTKPYYDFLGVKAEPIVDGLLLPWKNEFSTGTLWGVSHTSKEAFSTQDYEILSSLADFASIIIREQHQRKLLLEAERLRGVAEMAHTLAHRVNNPLQSLTNTLFLAGSRYAEDELLQQAQKDLARLSEQVSALLSFSAAKS